MSDLDLLDEAAWVDDASWVPPFLRLLAPALLALAVGFLVGWRAQTTFGSDHHRQMPPPLPANLALYEPEGGVARNPGTYPLLRDTRPSLTIAASGWAVLPHPVPTAVHRRSPRPPDSPAAGQALRDVHMTWYCLPGVSRCTTGYPASCRCVAVSPDLAELRGRTITICAGETCVEALVVDCSCAATRSVDAYASVFRQFVPLSRGTIEVTVR